MSIVTINLPLVGVEGTRKVTRSVAELFGKASNLEDTERAELAGLLLKSLDAELEAEQEAAWAEEIERRLRQFDIVAQESIQ